MAIEHVTSFTCTPDSIQTYIRDLVDSTLRASAPLWVTTQERAFWYLWKLCLLVVSTVCTCISTDACMCDRTGFTRVRVSQSTDVGNMIPPSFLVANLLHHAWIIGLIMCDGTYDLTRMWRSMRYTYLRNQSSIRCWLDVWLTLLCCAWRSSLPDIEDNRVFLCRAVLA